MALRGRGLQEYLGYTSGGCLEEAKCEDQQIQRKECAEVGKVGQEVEFGLEDHQEERLSREGL